MVGLVCSQPPTAFQLKFNWNAKSLPWRVKSGRIDQHRKRAAKFPRPPSVARSPCLLRLWLRLDGLNDGRVGPPLCFLNRDILPGLGTSTNLPRSCHNWLLLREVETATAPRCPMHLARYQGSGPTVQETTSTVDVWPRKRATSTRRFDQAVLRVLDVETPRRFAASAGRKGKGKEPLRLGTIYRKGFVMSTSDILDSTPTLEQPPVERGPHLLLNQGEVLRIFLPPGTGEATRRWLEQEAARRSSSVAQLV